jgi:uncharacterized protein YjbI with pentapeptide repeats
MTKDEIKSVLELHGRWLRNEPGGNRADLYGADLSCANLSRADLSRANLSRADLSRADLSCANLSCANLSRAKLSRADLSCANLSGANLSRADLSGADLSCANLSGANLYGADLSRANLSGANLSGANLYGADLSGANLYGADLYGAKNIPIKARLLTQIVPETGAFDAWKKCANNVIVHLLIPASANRSNATGRKCRAERAKVLAVYGDTVGIGLHDKTKYVVGKTVKCHEWEENRWIECAGGIHFFITRAEAEAY